MTDWFRHGHIPDETYFHTVLRHDKDLVVTTDDVTYVPIGRKTTDSALDGSETGRVAGVSGARARPSPARSTWWTGLRSSAPSMPRWIGGGLVGPGLDRPRSSADAGLAVCLRRSTSHLAIRRRVSPSSGCTAAERRPLPGCWSEWDWPLRRSTTSSRHEESNERGHWESESGDHAQLEGVGHPGGRIRTRRHRPHRAGRLVPKVRPTASRGCAVARPTRPTAGRSS